MISPLSFYQVNHAAAELLYHTAFEIASLEKYIIQVGMEPVNVNKNIAKNDYVCEKPFATFPNGFPKELLDEFTRRTGKEIIGNISQEKQLRRGRTQTYEHRR